MALVGWEGIEQRSDALPGCFFCPLCGLSEEVFEFCEHLLDWVEVRAVGRQKQKPRASRTNSGADGGLLVAGEIVHDDDVAWFERWAQLLFDPGGKAGGIDWLIEHERCVDPVAAQGGDEGHCLPMAVRHKGMKTLTNRSPSPQRRHIGLCPGLVDKNQTGRLNLLLVLLPLLAVTRDFGPQLFGGQDAFF